MARPQSEGLDYFPLDVDMDSDDKIEYIEAKYGLVAFGIIVRLMMAIYRQGYYMMWTERQQYVFSKKVNVDINHLSEIVNVCINEGVFDKNVYNTYKILTSHGIQTRYLRAVERRRSVRMIKEFSLLTNEDGIKEGRISYQNLAKNVNADNNTGSEGVNVDNNHDSNDISVDDMSAETTQSKVKYISTTTTTPLYPPCGTDAEFGKVISAYSDNIHPVTPMEAEILGGFLDIFSSDVILRAIMRAVKRGKRSIGYVEGILRSWQENGYDDDGERQQPKGESRIGAAKRDIRAPAGEDDRYADFREADRSQVHPWDISSSPGGAGEKPGGDSEHRGGPGDLPRV
jgi:DnaD/phage-associated family protein